MLLSVATPTELVLEETCQSVSLPTAIGRIQVLPGHAALMACLSKGVLSYVSNGANKEVTVEDGFIKIIDDKISIITPKAS